MNSDTAWTMPAWSRHLMSSVAVSIATVVCEDFADVLGNDTAGDDTAGDDTAALSLEVVLLGVVLLSIMRPIQKTKLSALHGHADSKNLIKV